MEHLGQHARAWVGNLDHRHVGLSPDAYDEVWALAPVMALKRCLAALGEADYARLRAWVLPGN